LAFAAQSILPGSVYEYLTGLRERTSSPAPLTDAVLARLMCLRCRATTLRRSKETITCRCGALYSQDRGVFDFDPQQ
jgi:hypothetical protein